MKALLYIIIGILLFSCTSKKENLGKLIIVEDYYPFYENDDMYIPHDYFVEIDMQEEWPVVRPFGVVQNKFIQIKGKIRINVTIN